MDLSSKIDATVIELVAKLCATKLTRTFYPTQEKN
jgi:hypothetical protein